MNAGIALAVVLVAVTARPAAGGPDPETVDTVVAPRQAETGRVRQHGLGLGYHVVLFATAASDRYAVHGPSVAYDYFIGRRWGFMMRVAAFDLIAGQMSGPSGEFMSGLDSYYDEHHRGVDAMGMAARRVPLSPRLVVTAGVGPHVQAFSMTGTRYSPVEAASLGLAGLGKLDYALNGWLSVAVALELGLDLLDLSDHQNPARWLVPVSSSLSLAARH